MRTLFGFFSADMEDLLSRFTELQSESWMHEDSRVRWNKRDSYIYAKAAVVIREQIKVSTRGASFHFKL